MKFARCSLNGKVFAGLVKDGRVFEIPDQAEVPIGSEVAEAQDRAFKIGVPLDKVRLLAPVTSFEKILCVAVNYRSHATEQNAAPPEEPYFFTKFRNALIGNGDPIIIPRIPRR